MGARHDLFEPVILVDVFINLDGSQLKELHPTVSISNTSSITTPETSH